MKISKENKVDELADVVSIATSPITSLPKLRSFLNAALLRLMNANASLAGYIKLLTSYKNKTATRIRVADDQRDFMTLTYLKQLYKLLEQVIKDAKRADLVRNNPIRLFPDLGLGDLEDEFKVAVVDEWIRFVQKTIPVFDGQKSIALLKQKQQVKGDQVGVYLFVSCFSGLKEKLAKQDAELLTIIEQATEADFSDICRKLILTIEKEFDLFKDDTEEITPKHTRSKKDVETLKDDDQAIDDAEDELTNDDDNDWDKYY